MDFTLDVLIDQLRMSQKSWCSKSWEIWAC